VAPFALQDYYNCSCIANWPEDTSQPMATSGQCSSGLCGQAIAFLVAFFVCVFAIFWCMTSNTSAILRWVKHKFTKTTADSEARLGDDIAEWLRVHVTGRRIPIHRKKLRHFLEQYCNAKVAGVGANASTVCETGFHATRHHAISTHKISVRRPLPIYTYQNCFPGEEVARYFDDAILTKQSHVRDVNTVTPGVKIFVC
jgi:hypothetical protein